MTGDQQIERRAALALAPGCTPEIGELDLLLTDGAAEILALRTELLRVNHRLAAVLGDGDRDLETWTERAGSRVAEVSSTRAGSDSAGC